MTFVFKPLSIIPLTLSLPALVFLHSKQTFQWVRMNSLLPQTRQRISGVRVSSRMWRADYCVKPHTVSFLHVVVQSPTSWDADAIREELGLGPLLRTILCNWQCRKPVFTRHCLREIFVHCDNGGAKDMHIELHCFLSYLLFNLWKRVREVQRVEIQAWHKVKISTCLKPTDWTWSHKNIRRTSQRF